MTQHATPHNTKQRATSTSARDRIAASFSATQLSHSEADEARRLKLLNVNDAAAVLAVSKRTLQQLTADRLLAAVRFGRNVRYSIEDLQRFVESRTVKESGWKGGAR
jgi:excisionase family DNA binding protein